MRDIRLQLLKIEYYLLMHVKTFLLVLYVYWFYITSTHALCRHECDSFPNGKLSTVNYDPNLFWMLGQFSIRLWCSTRKQYLIFLKNYEEPILARMMWMKIQRQDLWDKKSTMQNKGASNQLRLAHWPKELYWYPCHLGQCA